jgi:pimeloyl-ACP methyl ester carboxylesterase
MDTRKRPGWQVRRVRVPLRIGGRKIEAARLHVPDPVDDATLVFLHEGLGCIPFWKDVPDELCARLGMHGLIYDRPGHGGSDPPEGPRTARYLHEEAERVLPEVLAAAGIVAPVPIGHSDGGTIALLYAAAFPDRLLAAVTLAAHVFVEEETVAGIRAAVGEWETAGLRARLERFHGEGTEALFRAWADTWLAPWFRDWRIEDALPRIRCPLLVIQGAGDEYGTPAQVQAIVGGSGGATRSLLIPACGHDPHLQARATTLDAIVGFVEEALRRRPVDQGRDPA